MQTVHHSRYRWLSVLPWALVMALLATNAATLLNAELHEVAYGAVERVLSAFDERSRLAITSSSLTVVNKVKSESALKDLRARAERAEQALQEAKTQVGLVDAENKRLLQRAARHRELISRIGSEAIRQLATRSARAITTAPTRMIPYAGVVAETAFLTWELQIDCALARSLNQMVREIEAAPEDAGRVCNWVDKVPSAQQLWAEVKNSATRAARKTYEVIERAE